MSCVNVQLIDPDECIGASLPKINGNFAALSAAVCELSASTPFDVVDSPTIDLTWNSSTNTLRADVDVAGLDISSSTAALKAWVVFDPFTGFNSIYGYTANTNPAIESLNVTSVSRAAWTGIGWPGVVPSPAPAYTFTFPSGLFSGSNYFVCYTFSNGNGLQRENLAAVTNKTVTSVTVSMTNVYNAQTNTGDNLADYRVHVHFFGT